MNQVRPKKLVIFASLFTAFLLIGFLNLIKLRDNSITGNVIVESSEEKASLLLVFVVISLIAGALTFLTIIYKQNRRY